MGWFLHTNQRSQNQTLHRVTSKARETTPHWVSWLPHQKPGGHFSLPSFIADPVRIAGGAKCLASPDNEAERAFVLEQIHKSIRLHFYADRVAHAPL